MNIAVVMIHSHGADTVRCQKETRTPMAYTLNASCSNSRLFMANAASHLPCTGVHPATPVNLPDVSRTGSSVMNGGVVSTDDMFAQLT